MNFLEIQQWDWRYKIAYNKTLADSVYQTIALIPDPKERKIYTEIFEAHHKFVSVLQLTQDIRSGEQPMETLTVLDQHPDLSNISSEVIAQVEFLFKDALSHPLVIQLLERLKKEHTKKIWQNATSWLPLFFKEDFIREIPIELQKAEISSPVSKIFSIKEFTSKATTIHEKYLNRAKEMGFQYQMTIDENLGFAEYWPHFMTEKMFNELIVHKNQNNLCEYNLDLTFAHEVTPGHGFFYLTQHANPNQFIDQGAFFLIEGWATYCEWLQTENPRHEYNKNAGFATLKALLSINSAEESSQALHKIYQYLGYSKDYINELVATAVQKPLFLESYYLGALWFLKKTSINSASEFKDFMREKNWADSFKLW